jgi:hypothetical protein
MFSLVQSQGPAYQIQTRMFETELKLELFFRKTNNSIMMPYFRILFRETQKQHKLKVKGQNICLKAKNVHFEVKNVSVEVKNVSFESKYVLSKVQNVRFRYVVEVKGQKRTFSSNFVF